MTEAELLFSEALNCSRASLYLDKDKILEKTRASFISSVLKRRVCGEPLEYILGKTEFMGLEFKVTPDVLIPRQETEILVDTAIKLAAGRLPQAVNILDIGTGCGCIAVSLAKFLVGAKIDAIDVSRNALKVARDNAKLNGVADKIKFIQSNLFESLPICDLQYALCISNPPYIPSVEIEELQPEIRYEPRIALDGGQDGLDFFRRIISEAPVYLKEGGFLILEMGFSQKAQIENIFQKTENFEIIEVAKDYNNIDRVVVAKKNN